MAHDADLLTPAEHAIVDAVARLGDRFRELLAPDEPAATVDAVADWDYVRSHLIALGRFVAANAAARRYGTVRLVGGHPAPVDPPQALLGVPDVDGGFRLERPVDALERANHDPLIVVLAPGARALACSCGDGDPERIVWSLDEPGQALLVQHLVGNGWGEVPAVDAVAEVATGQRTLAEPDPPAPDPRHYPVSWPTSSGADLGCNCGERADVAPGLLVEHLVEHGWDRHGATVRANDVWQIVKRARELTELDAAIAEHEPLDVEGELTCKCGRRFEGYDAARMIAHLVAVGADPADAEAAVDGLLVVDADIADS